MSKKARQLRALRSWLGLPEKTQEEISDDYEDFEDYEDCDSYEDSENVISDYDEYGYDYDYDSDTEDFDSAENLEDSLDSEALFFRNYAEQSRAAIARTFTVGSCYQVVTNKSIIKRLKAGEKYVLQSINTSGNDPEVDTFRYLGKQGIHHMFREICGGWGRTYTDAQLVGKEVVEVSESEVRAVNRSLKRSGIRF